MIILIIGSEGTGKTVLAAHLYARLCLNRQKTIHIEGEFVRALYNNPDFSELGRSLNAMCSGQLCYYLAQREYLVIMTAVLPTLAARDTFRRACQTRIALVHLNNPPFVDREHGVKSEIHRDPSCEPALNLDMRATSFKEAVYAINAHVGSILDGTIKTETR